jgi:hypothetical protein
MVAGREDAGVLEDDPPRRVATPARRGFVMGADPVQRLRHQRSLRRAETDIDSITCSLHPSGK